jgi:hypothetical protein
VATAGEHVPSRERAAHLQWRRIPLPQEGRIEDDMKRSLVTLGILFSLTLALFPAAAFASEAFILNIPLRFNANQETGEVRFALDLSAPPAGSQLVVNGNITLSLGDT